MSFKTDLERGKQGEQLVANTLSRRGWQITDLRNSAEYQKKDIDFIVSKDTIETTIEIKHDARINKTGNMYIEIESNDRTSRKGWFYYCEAEYLFYIDAVVAAAHIFKMEDLRQYTKLVTCATAQCNDGYKSSTGLLVSVEHFKNWLLQNKTFYQELIL